MHLGSKNRPYERRIISDYFVTKCPRILSHKTHTQLCNRWSVRGPSPTEYSRRQKCCLSRRRDPPSLYETFFKQTGKVRGKSINVASKNHLLVHAGGGNERFSCPSCAEPSTHTGLRAKYARDIWLRKKNGDSFVSY